MAKMTGSDRLNLADEPTMPVEREDIPRWKVLVVDDEDEIHRITRLALADFRFAGRDLEFISAYSGAEAQELLLQHPDVAIILLDVVMETDDAGLLFARFVRQTVGNQFVRIILRTGQPGMAPERQIMKVFDINDYRAKTELTQDRLYTVMQTALASYRDMAALARSRRQLVGIVDELDKLSEISSEHVRQPLKEVLTTAQALHSQLQDTLSPDQLRMLEKIKSLTTDMYLRVDDLVRLTETGNFNDERSPLNMTELVNEAMQSLAQEISDCGAEITVDNLPLVTGSRRQLLQLMVNLLSNSLQFRGECSPEVLVACSRQGDYWCFRVDDNGIGILVEERQAVFSLFRRSGHKQVAVGSGIGLNICRKVVRWHGGEIRIDDSPIGGTRIEFTLPVTDS